MHARKLIGLLVLSWALPVAAAPQGSPVEWLDRMSTAFRSENYQGFFIYENLGGLLTLKVMHGVVDGQEKERLVYLDGPYREMIRDGQKIAYIRQGQGGVTLKPGYLSALSGRFKTDFQQLSNHYQLRFAGDARVANRIGRHVELLPRDKHRYGYHLWLDHDSGLLLKSEMHGDKGAVLERFQFVDLDVGSLDAANVIPPGQHAWRDRSAAVASSDDASLSWEMGWVPEGFDKTGYRKTVSPVSQKPVDSLLYSDGLAAFSVFVEEDMTRVLSQSSEQSGATAAVSRVFRNGDAYYNVTVVGEIPLGTAERIAVSVKPRQMETPPQAPAK
ncbi:MucB/RseB C-terminal domain-containing protein [Kistimonas asteriae]|uniref:MucB/RseB C-terminal domain-containing protein n=1 Tax=Kistimonas asteriae TaxID=517724 RepID=UPI001BAC0499|nr:MucB/RseB C-terminal domain-containing protein [Kistimonas asteriae]